MDKNDKAFNCWVIKDVAHLISPDNFNLLLEAAKALVKSGIRSDPDELTRLRKAFRKMSYLIPQEHEKWGKAVTEMLGAMEAMADYLVKNPTTEQEACGFVTLFHATLSGARKGRVRKSLDGKIELEFDDGDRMPMN